MIICSKNNEIIEIAFPEKKYQAYRSLLKKDSSTSLSYKEQKQLFITTIHDFFSGKLSVDELAAIAGHEWEVLSPENKNSSELGEVLHAASELSYSVRHIVDDKLNMFTSFIKKVSAYYEKNKFANILLDIC